VFPNRILNHSFKWYQNSDRQKMMDRILNSENSKHDSQSNPLLWLKIVQGVDHDCQVYFVNDASEIVTAIIPHSFGYISYDETTSPLLNNNQRTFSDVLQNEAVLIDTFHLIYDSDSYIGLSIEINSPLTGHVIITTPTSKGKIEEQYIFSDGIFNPKLAIEFKAKTI
jgi:hypothetical protein